VITRFDHSVDQALERVRTSRWHRLPDTVFRTASVLGDFSLVWHLTAAVRGLTSDHHANQAMIMWLLVALESLVVNQGIKRVFRRQRPMAAGDPRYTVRTPSTSSFPSGHASSAFFVATVLIGWDGWAWSPLWLALALVVACSRAYVRIHHASDVAGGMVVGVGLGVIARLVLASLGV
jgi:undecaprenyl-diphosphatase